MYICFFDYEIPGQSRLAGGSCSNNDEDNCTEMDERHIDTLLIHGRETARRPVEATLPPVTLSTAFDFDSAERMEAVFTGREDAPFYSRMQNPTVEALEARVKESCGAASALALASGMTAIALGLMNLLRSGDEVLASPYLFGGSYTLFTRTLADLGIVTRFADPTDAGAFEALIGPKTRAVFVEALANPALVVPDFPALRALCGRHGLPLLVDATLLTPYLFDGEALGADVAFFSGTKYLAGPASTVAGLIVDTGRFPWHESALFDFGDFKRAGQGAFMTKLRKQAMAAVGPCLSPMSAFLLLTGLETLPLRMERQCETAQRVAAYLREHPRVEKVSYPGLPDHPAHDLSRAHFKGRFGGVLSFHLENKAECFRVLNAFDLIRRSTNLGDTRTLAVHPASTIYGTFWKHEQEEVGVTENMIRLSLGIEHPGDILADCDQALNAA